MEQPAEVTAFALAKDTTVAATVGDMVIITIAIIIIIIATTPVSLRVAR
jgi:hypothetical protein